MMVSTLEARCLSFGQTPSFEELKKQIFIRISTLSHNTGRRYFTSVRAVILGRIINQKWDDNLDMPDWLISGKEDEIIDLQKTVLRTHSKGQPDARIFKLAVSLGWVVCEDQHRDALSLAGVDHEGKVLESFVTKRCDRKEAYKLIRQSMKHYGRVNVLVTVKLRSCYEGDWQCGQIGNWPLPQQSSRESAPAS
jgi:hypothetical protein